MVDLMMEVMRQGKEEAEGKQREKGWKSGEDGETREKRAGRLKGRAKAALASLEKPPPTGNGWRPELEPGGPRELWVSEADRGRKVSRSRELGIRRAEQEAVLRMVA